MRKTVCIGLVDCIILTPLQVAAMVNIIIHVDADFDFDFLKIYLGAIFISHVMVLAVSTFFLFYI